jgi:hypothetical protein
MHAVAQLSKLPHALTPVLRVALGAALALALSPHAWAQDTPPPGATPAAIPGEEDTDGDGIPDNEDACKRVKGVASDVPRDNGCPPPAPPPPPADADKDGIADADDACPKKKGVASDDPKLNGCPPVATQAVAALRARPTRAAHTQTVSSSPGGSAELTYSGFHSFDDGTSLLFVELSGPVTIDETKGRDGIVYTLENTRVPIRNNRNPLLTGDFSTTLSRATFTQKKKAVELSLVLKADVQPSHQLVQRGGVTVLEIRLPTAPLGATTTTKGR